MHVLLFLLHCDLADSYQQTDPVREAVVSDLEQQVAALTARNEELEASLTAKNKQLRCSITKNYPLNQENTTLKKKIATLEALSVETTTANVETHQKVYNHALY